MVRQQSLSKAKKIESIGSKRKSYPFNVNGYQSFSEFVSVKDLGVLFGFGLFETMRIYDGIPFLLSKHLQRIRASLKELGFEVIPRMAELSRLVGRYIERKAILSGVLRLSITAGNKSELIPGTISILDREIPYTKEEYVTGVSAATVSFSKRNEFSTLLRHKTLNAMENLISLQACLKHNNKECLFLNTSGFIAEGSKSNIFFVKGNTIFTPSVACGLLPGITREHVIALLREEELEVKEGRFLPVDLLSSDECFLTNSVMEIMPLVKIDNSSIGGGIPGKITNLVSNLYGRSVRKATQGAKK